MGNGKDDGTAYLWVAIWIKLAFTFATVASSRPCWEVGRPMTAEVAAKRIIREEKIMVMSRSS